MRTVAERLAGGRTASAQRGAKPDTLPVDLEGRTNRIRPVLTQGQEVDRWCRLVVTILAPVTQRSRWALSNRTTDQLRLGRIRVDPRALHIREEGRGRLRDAKASVDAASLIKHDREVPAFDHLDTLIRLDRGGGDRSGRWCHCRGGHGLGGGRVAKTPDQIVQQFRGPLTARVGLIDGLRGHTQFFHSFDIIAPRARSRGE